MKTDCYMYEESIGKCLCCNVMYCTHKTGCRLYKKRKEPKKRTENQEKED